MNKHTFRTLSLQKGEINLYDFGAIKLHAYKTNDPMDDEVFIFEKDGRAVVLESPCFFDNIEALKDYLKDMRVEGMLIAYHGAGASFLPHARKYATQNARDYSVSGGGKALIDGFTQAFGPSFDSSVHEITDILPEGKAAIGGIDFIIHPSAKAFDVEIPEINAVYTHMLGHDCHSIVAGAAHADGMIAQLQDYIARGYDLILTSHYTPEDLKDVQTKIGYLENLKAIAAGSPDAAAFKAGVRRQYPAYGGENYLNMTTGFFFPQN